MNLLNSAFTLSCCLCLIHQINGYTYGVDTSGYVSTSDLSCLVNNGYSFTIARIYESVGAVDKNGAASMANAWNAGMSHVDGYIFPCYPCYSLSGADQASAALSYLQDNGVKFGQIWIDVEIYNWGSSCSENVKFLGDIVAYLQQKGVSVGIYTNYNNWSTITCNSNVFSALPLWYAHYDGDPSFGDFSPFGGWTTPAIKQYEGDKTECGVGIDKNSY